jgi:hypothetical protein
MQATIEGYVFDLTKTVYLVTATNKFWEANLNAKIVRFRVGKNKDSLETNIEEISKTYPTN